MKLVKKGLRIISKLITVILSLAVLYLIVSMVVPFIGTNPKESNGSKEITVYLVTNGVHSDIVVPISNETKDWSKEILFKNTLSKREDYQYVGIGWGDKGFYLNTPTWSDLKISTALNAAFSLSTSAMHCTFYVALNEGDDCVKLLLTKEEYENLIEFISKRFQRDENGNLILIETDAVYGDNDAFYEAKGRYNLFYTCNTWTNNGLKAANQKAAIWTITDFGIFKHYNEGGRLYIETN